MATHEPVGSLAEEAAKLFAALQGWASDRTAGTADRTAGTADRTAGTADRDRGAADGATSAAEDATTSRAASAAGSAAGGSAAGGDRAEGATGGDRAQGADSARYADEHAAGQHLSVECRYCPLCSVARFARAASPEVRDHLTSAALSMTLAVKGLLEGLDRDRPEPRREPVEKIDLMED